MGRKKKEQISDTAEVKAPEKEESLSQKKKKKKNDKKKIVETVKVETEEELSKEKILAFKTLVAPDGVNPNPLSYTILHDAGKDIYVRTLTVSKTPRLINFAQTFETMRKFHNTTYSVYIDPLNDGAASRLLDKRILQLGSEEIQARKEGDENRLRKISAIKARTERWATEIESGMNSFYEVSFLFSIFADSIDQLDIRTSDFVSLARERGVEVASCYGLNAEAYNMNGPFNTRKIMKMSGDTAKKHILDRRGLAGIYSHTSSTFTHVNGVPLGRERRTGNPFLFDPFDDTHMCYNIVICGESGSGKSAMIKMMTSRMKPFGVRTAFIDTEKKGNGGEFSINVRRNGGVVFEVKTNSGNILNFFDIDVHEEYDETKDIEYQSLRVLDKINDVVNIIMIMLRGENAEPDFSTTTYLNRIITDIVAELYEERGIREGDVNSLYENRVEQGRLTSGTKRRKLMPTVSDFYLKVKKHRRVDADPFHASAYSLLEDGIKDYVKELYLNTATLERVDKDTYLKAMETDPEQKNYQCIKGIRGYYDGQSTVSFNRDIPMFSIDISDLPKKDQVIAQQIALNYTDEYFVKTNSENPKLAKECLVVIDEAHRSFKDEYSRKLIADKYATARKRHVGMVTCTQTIDQFGDYSETRDIITNSSSIFLFRHKPGAREYIKKVTPMRESEIREVFSIGDPTDTEDKTHKGEVVLIDVGRVISLKVDYLEQTEAAIVETDISKIQEMYR